MSKYKITLKPQSSSDVLEKKKEILSLIDKPEQVDFLLSLLDGVFSNSNVEKYSAISKDDFAFLLEARCKAAMAKADQLSEKEEKSLALLKALNSGQECVINQPTFAPGYVLYAEAFTSFAKLGDHDKVFDDKHERELIKNIREIGLGVVQSLKSGLDIGEISRAQKGEIHNQIAKCLESIFCSVDDYVAGEDQSEMSFEQVQQLMFARQNLMFSGGMDALERKADEFVEKVTASPNTHLRSKMYQLRIQVLNFRPHIWRRVKVPGSITLQSLQDRVISPVLGWCRNYHAYYFRKIPFEQRAAINPRIPSPDLVFGPIYSQAVDKMHEFSHNVYSSDDTKVELFHLLEKTGDELFYLYDLGDSFRHKITVENIEDSNDQTITVEDGENCCPPEDCGSIHRYADAIQIYYYGNVFKNNPSFAKDKESHSEIMSSLNKAANYLERKGSFNPTSFSLVDTKRHVQNALRSNVSKMDDSNFCSYNFQTGRSKIGAFEETKMLSKTPVKACAICDSTQNLKQCSKCRSVYYCSREHQLKDWTNHKNLCGKEKK